VKDIILRFFVNKMSDYGDGNDGQEFEYEWPDDADQENEINEVEIELRNTFYTADENKKLRPKEAIEQYENVVVMEEQMGDEINFRFKALENIVVLSAQVGFYDKMISN
jgi:hypothetical protein